MGRGSSGNGPGRPQGLTDDENGVTRGENRIRGFRNAEVCDSVFGSDERGNAEILSLGNDNSLPFDSLGWKCDF